MATTTPSERIGHAAAAFGLAREGGRTLLVQNDRIVRGVPTPCWDLPGGGLQPGETPPTALVREWREETGLVAQVGDLRLVVDGTKRVAAGAPPRRSWRAFIFDVATSGTPSAGAGIDACVWVADEELVEHLSAPYHAALREHLAGDPRRYRTVDWIDAGATEVDAWTCLLQLAAAGTRGVAEETARVAQRAHALGVTPSRLAETLRQLVPYVGFPRAIEAFTAVRRVYDVADAGPADDPSSSASRGAATFAAVYGQRHERVAGGLLALDEVLARWTQQFAYGTVLCREGVLTLGERELLAVTILSALGNATAPLEGHRRAALRLGASEADVAIALAAGRG
jgi:alkylhydroperoxidase/carboxymuconolactone decarboxylase family protein YurZ/8-oxo-dGTP pyrophosphatase MutT (NUDIX family)